MFKRHGSKIAKREAFRLVKVPNIPRVVGLENEKTLTKPILYLTHLYAKVPDSDLQNAKEKLLGNKRP